jgi:hypothetical protein
MSRGGVSELLHELDQLRAEREALCDALRSIAANTCCDRCQESALVARAALVKVSACELDTPENLAALRIAGCACPLPLFGYRPNVGPRCRLCNTAALAKVDA